MKKSGFKSLLKKIRPYAVPGIITGLVMIVILILKGIWPFGSSRIDYFDNMQQVAPLYAHLWDSCMVRHQYGLTGIQVLEQMCQ